jgi:aspartate ammonia-lyase
MRIESDELGEVAIPDGALYGIQSARARDNFSLNYRRTSLLLVYAMVKIKKAAALCYGKPPGASEAGIEKFRAIAEACDHILSGEADGDFIVDALQGGAGTSTNMNVNEVVANMALKLLGKPAGSYSVIHPLDDVNRGQSTNDVYPTALRIAAIDLLRKLSDHCAKLQEALQKKENEYDGIKKLGRTELMDAVPVTLGGEFGAYAQAIGRDRWRLYKVEERLRQVNLGGAAVGLTARTDGRNNDKSAALYRFKVIEELRELTGIGLAPAEYPMDLTQNADVYVEVSGLLKGLAVNIIKIANDFRLMNSGPRGGLGEITLAPLQKGSTIMPGKVNPVIPEMAIQAAIKVIANDGAITEAAARGEFELNAFSPLIADALLENLSLLCRTVFLFRTSCVETLVPRQERCAALLETSLAFAASYVPQLGYGRVSKIVAENHGDREKIQKALEAALIPGRTEEAK